ncbi:uncharacterized protein PV06_07008 [Exophiala oligosperma]|uniref:Oxidase FUB9 n=1 Tax=Exophiala oligosperma TaxID=215243 RepID=A0A0D2DGB5_9EURO|nr:uncharacterized protein PV06_07008 [Exophiala oligosperma]KIW41450.1 hypothetical protein PV06_07008 [Exophiala oligosperma]
MSTAQSKPQILTIDDLEHHATLHLPKMVREYYNGGSMDSYTLQSNVHAYRQWYIMPRMLRDVSRIDTSAQVFDRKVTFPCCVAPAAMQKMAHPDGEEATARAAGDKGVVMGLSSFSTTSLEVVKKECDEATATVEGACVLQMYLFENRKVGEDLISRAEKSGYKAIVLTIDTPYFGRRLTELRNNFKVPSHLTMANFDASLGVKTESSRKTTTNPPPNKNDPSLTWDVIQYLKSITSLKIFVKGVLAASDAQLAVRHGADGIIVSNHGGRQLDCAPPTLEVLPEIVDVVGGRIPVHFDGGIRRGSDIFKALCLGADMCWVGRPVLWGLAYDGERGVKMALDILEEEFRACMALTGMRSVEEIRQYGRSLLRRVSTTPWDIQLSRQAKVKSSL